MIKVSIVDGPCRDDLFKCYMKCFDNVKIIVTFKVQELKPVTGTIIDLRHESGSGNDFIFTIRTKSGDFEGFYNSHNRNGWVDISALIPNNLYR